MVHTKATVKLATAATPTLGQENVILYNYVVSIVPTSHHMTTNAGKTGMKEVRMPLSSVRSENTVMEVLRPQVSDTRPARKVPSANLGSCHQYSKIKA